MATRRIEKKATSFNIDKGSIKLSNPSSTFKRPSASGDREYRYAGLAKIKKTMGFKK